MSQLGIRASAQQALCCVSCDPAPILADLDANHYVSSLMCCSDKHSSSTVSWQSLRRYSQTARPKRWPSRAPALGTDVMTGTAVPSQNVAQCLNAITPAVTIRTSDGWERHRA